MTGLLALLTLTVSLSQYTVSIPGLISRDLLPPTRTNTQDISKGYLAGPLLPVPGGLHSRRLLWFWGNDEDENNVPKSTTGAPYNDGVTTTKRPSRWSRWKSKVGNAFKELGNDIKGAANATKWAVKKAGRKVKEGFKKGYKKIKMKIMSVDDKLNHFANRLKAQAEKGNEKAIRLLQKLGIYATVEDGKVIRVDVEDEIDSVSNILEKEGVLKVVSTTTPKTTKISTPQMITTKPPKLTSETITTTTEAPTTSTEILKTTLEITTVKTTTTERPIPTTEPAKPTTEPAKPTTEPAKPTTEIIKTTTESPKTKVETLKTTIKITTVEQPFKTDSPSILESADNDRGDVPIDDKDTYVDSSYADEDKDEEVYSPPKLTTEPPKPKTEPAKPTTEPAKPTAEPAKPTTEIIKTTTETPKTTVETLKTTMKISTIEQPFKTDSPSILESPDNDRGDVPVDDKDTYVDSSYVDEDKDEEVYSPPPFPDVFGDSRVKNRLMELYEKGDFTHSELADLFDPDYYEYYYDYE